VQAAFILIGFSATIAQIILLRELMVVFYGNEISIGLMLASWLFWTALGSSLVGRLIRHPGKMYRTMAKIQAALALVLPATILTVRESKALLQTVTGEILGPGVMLLASLAMLGVFCMLSGALFTVGSALYAVESSTSAARATGSVYLWEAVGSSLGGLMAGLMLIRHLGSIEIALVVSLLNLLIAANLMGPAADWGGHPTTRHALIGSLLGASILVVIGGGPAVLERISQVGSWRGMHLLATRNSAYGNLAVVGTEGSRSLYENGIVLFTAPDPAAAEEAVEYALLEHPAPRSLLLIGGGINGSLSLALAHPGIERVDYVELDPAILALARDYFPQEWQPIASDPRVRVHVTDGRLFLKTTDSHFDVIVVNLPDPQTAQLNRFYTVEFFAEAERRLTPTGLLSFRLTGSEDYISPALAEFLRSIEKSLRAVFPEVKLLPGAPVHFFAARSAGVLASGRDEIVARLRRRNLHTKYVREYYIPFRMMPDRMRDLEAQIEPVPTTPINRDFAPIAYYFGAALWSSQFHQGYRRFLGTLARIDFAYVTTATAVFLLVVCLKRKSRPKIAGGCAAAMGFSMIGLEILLLLGFQAIYGYVYYQLAVVIAAFMAGMALGTWMALRSAVQRALRALVALQAAAALAPLVLYGLFQALPRGPLMFPLLAVGCGMLGGYEFPITSGVFFSSQKERGRGALYALDLAGSSAGAILFSVYFIPVFGFFRTAVLSAMVSLAPAALALRAAPTSSALRPAHDVRTPAL